MIDELKLTKLKSKPEIKSKHFIKINPIKLNHFSPIKKNFFPKIDMSISINKDSITISECEIAKKTNNYFLPYVSNKKCVLSPLVSISTIKNHYRHKSISNASDASHHKKKFKTLINRKINEKKYSNVPNHSKLSSSNFNDIDESIPTIEYSSFQQGGNKLIHSKTNPNSIGGNIISNGSNSSDPIFKTKIFNADIFDNFLHKLTKGKEFDWVAGDIISEGNNSVVYKAMTTNGKFIVVKRFNCVQGSQCDNFVNEVSIYKQLSHENIIKYYSNEIIKNSYFIYLEYMPNGSLRNVIDTFGALNENLIRKFLKQIINGLKYLHSKGIVHRDIKCANILLDQNGNVKLTDFGCSKQISITLSDSSSNEEFCSSLKGTIPWCAPEVICLKKYGKKADIWSLGCTIIEMTGNQPWGKMDNLYQVMNKIGKTNDIPNIPNNLSDKLKSLISSCLTRDPRLRPNLKNLQNHKFFGFQ